MPRDYLKEFSTKSISLGAILYFHELILFCSKNIIFQFQFTQVACDKKYFGDFYQTHSEQKQKDSVTSESTTRMLVYFHYITQYSV